MRRAAALAALVLGCLACDDGIEDPREAEIVNVMAAADEPLIRQRPALSAGKYAKMASGVYPYYRGTLAIWDNDVRTGATAFSMSRFAMDLPLVPSLGDPHPENFGVLRAGDKTPAFEANDLDAADRLPYLWDVRRLAAGIGLVGPPSAIAAAMTAYRSAIETAAATGALPPRIVEGGVGGPIVADLFKRSERDYPIRRELTDDTIVTNGKRTFIRGIPDPTDPQGIFDPLPPDAIAALPATISAWRDSLIIQPPLDQLTVLDAVRELGSGVSSWARVRVLVLLRGPTDDPSDDFIVEMKEATDSGAGGWVGAGVYADSAGQRAVEAGRAAWSRLDAEPLWGWSTWLGFPVLIRSESAGEKGVSTARFTADLGTADALEQLGTALGTLVARAHASEAKAIAARIAIDRDGFIDEQVQAGSSYAALVTADYARFVASLHRTNGMRLGIPLDPADAPPPDLAAVFGSPPPPMALP